MLTRPKLTDRQQQILDLIQSAIARTGAPPTRAEIAAELGMGEDQEGLVVRAVDPTSDAADKGLSAGDVITEAGQQPVASLADLQARIKEAREAGRKSLLMMVRRAGEPRFVALPVE